MPPTSMATMPVSVVPYASPTVTPYRSANRAATSGGISSPPETAIRRSGSSGGSVAAASSS